MTALYWLLCLACLFGAIFLVSLAVTWLVTTSARRSVEDPPDLGRASPPDRNGDE